jgi:hypothetical protein
MVVTTAVILLFVALALRHPSRHGGAFPRPLFFMNCLLLACLILLLPTAYGVLQLPNRFQRVYVEFTTDTEGILEPLESGNYFLIEYFKADRLYYYLYSPEHCKMWLVPSVRVLNLSFTQIADVFEYRRPIGGHPSGGGDPTGHREAPDE